MRSLSLDKARITTGQVLGDWQRQNMDQKAGNKTSATR